MGPPSPEDPANRRLPSAVVMVRALMVAEPFLASDPATVTVSPSFTEFLFHGDSDSNISVNDSYGIKSAFTANGDPYKLTVISGGHTIWDGVYASPDLWTWVYQQTR